MTSQPTQFQIDGDVLDAVGADSTLLCVVSPIEDEDLARAQQAALELAVRREARLLLYDRGDETWGESDHSYLAPTDTVDLDRSPHLAAPLEAAAAAGLEVAVWHSIIPTIGTGIVNAIQNADVDVVVLPASGGVTSVTDRMLEGGSSLVGAVGAVLAKPVASDAHADVPVVVVSPSGEVRLAS